MDCLCVLIFCPWETRGCNLVQFCWEQGIWGGEQMKSKAQQMSYILILIYLVPCNRRLWPGFSGAQMPRIPVLLQRHASNCLFPLQCQQPRFCWDRLLMWGFLRKRECRDTSSHIRLPCPPSALGTPDALSPLETPLPRSCV